MPHPWNEWASGVQHGWAGYKDASQHAWFWSQVAQAALRQSLAETEIDRDWCEEALDEARACIDAACNRLDDYLRENRGAARLAVYQAYRLLHDARAKWAREG